MGILYLFMMIYATNRLKMLHTICLTYDNDKVHQQRSLLRKCTEYEIINKSNGTFEIWNFLYLNCDVAHCGFQVVTQILYQIINILHKYSSLS